ncbi:MAG: hypothetical protein H0V09_05830 [Gemmatimonadetes bacterium]|nr:hypothetical protein [Gemmatimonadota bacterium]
MTGTLPHPPLDLAPEEAAARFDRLQQRLVPLWASIRSLTQDEQTIVVVPSMSVEIALSGAEMQAYEERFLFLLLLLRQPRARLVYVTSQAIAPNIIDYYLDLLPGVISSHARQRLFLVAPLDGSPRPLSRKLLERPRLIEHIRSLIPDPRRAHLVPFITTWLERDLALRLGIPMYGADPKFLPLGSKSGCRRLFAEEGVLHPLGQEDLTSEVQLVAAIAEMRKRRPALSQVIVKLNEGVSGEGNAVVDLAGLPADGTEGTTTEEGVASRVRAMRCEHPGLGCESFLAKLAIHGGVVEERIQGHEFRSPSVQLRVNPLGEIELLSTHDQVLGGASGQSYLGCRFPADPEYAPAITREAAKVGARLAKEGVLGRFALDFVVVRSDDGGWEPYAIELNLRKGGTTHPFLTLQFLTDGTYDPETATFTAPGGRRKFFMASDHVESPLYRVFTPADLFDIVARHGLHFDPTRQTGVVFHMMSAMGECGRLGLIAVGDSPAEVDAIYARALAVLDEEARAALTYADPDLKRD